MLTSLSVPYSLTDQGFVFALHDLAEPPFYWQQALAGMTQSHGGISYAFDQARSVCLLRFIGILTLSVSLDTKTINIWPEARLTEQGLKRVLIDQLVPRIYAAQGALVLHAGAVFMRDRAVALMGDSGAGKSTLTASLYCHGASLINDDSVEVLIKNDQFYLSASHPSLRLLPDSLLNLFADTAESTSVSRFTDKRHVIISDGKRHENPNFPLAALFFIGKEPAEEISLRLIPPAKAVITIIANSFALNPTDPEFATANFYRACNLAEKVPAYELNYPRSYEALADVHQAIFNKLDELRV